MLHSRLIILRAVVGLSVAASAFGARQRSERLKSERVDQGTLSTQPKRHFAVSGRARRALSVRLACRYRGVRLARKVGKSDSWARGPVPCSSHYSRTNPITAPAQDWAHSAHIAHAHMHTVIMPSCCVLHVAHHLAPVACCTGCCVLHGTRCTCIRPLCSCTQQRRRAVALLHCGSTRVRYLSRDDDVRNESIVNRNKRALLADRAH